MSTSMGFVINLRVFKLAPKILLASAGIILNLGLISIGPAKAASTYDASTIAVLGLSTTGSFFDLDFVGSQVGYSAHAEANSNGVQDRESVNEPLFKTGTPVSFGSLFSSGQDLTDLLLKLNTGRQLFTNVSAMAGGAKATGSNEASSPGGNGGRFKVSVDGKATDPVESANSRVRWDLLLAFENTSNATLDIEWSLTYAFHNEAHADPRGSAYSESIIRAARGTYDNGSRVFETNIFDVAAGACGHNHPTCTLGETPPDKPNMTALFAQALAPGERAFFNIEMIAAGNASVVPVPAALPLFGTGLALFGVLTWRRKQRAGA